MKTSFSLISFLLASNLVFGQIEWVGNHDFSESATDLVRTSQNQYILAHNGLTVLDSVGNIVYNGLTNDYPDADGGLFSEIVELPDSSILLSVSFWECDVIIDMILKFDKNWNEVWQTYASFSKAIGYFSDNSAIYAGWEVSRWLPDGTKAWDTYFFQFYVNDLVVLPNDTVLLATSTGIFTMNADGQLLDSLTNYVLDKIELLPDGTILGFTSNSLYRFAPDFTQIGFFIQLGQAFEDVAIGQDEIAVLTSANNIIRLNFDLQPLGTTNLTGHNQTFTSFCFAEGGLMLAGSEQFGNDEHGNHSAFIKFFDLNANTAQTAEDAALTAISQTGDLEVESNWGLYTITIPNIQVTVTNNGEETIERLNVNFSWPEAGSFPCSFSNSFTKTFEDINLLPGATTQLDWGELPIRTWEDFSGEQIELCFWTSLPNNHLETNNINDVSCTEVLVQDFEPFPLVFNSTFIAVTDLLYLDMWSLIDIADIHVFNAAGQLVHADKMESQYGQLDMSGLPDGAYFFKIQAGEQLGWGRFVKY